MRPSSVLLKLKRRTEEYLPALVLEHSSDAVAGAEDSFIRLHVVFQIAAAAAVAVIVVIAVAVIAVITVAVDVVDVADVDATIGPLATKMKMSATSGACATGV